ncbi:MAG: dephospho-CoA kinase [Planctomycetia bacterium]|nr:dephospho-CoA kinase [Planctomycetia bacterium]
MSNKSNCSSPSRFKWGSDPVLGIIGGIASGKSHVTTEFQRQGALRFDADAMTRELYSVPEFVEKLRARWPSAVDQNGVVLRASLAAIVFQDSDAGRVQLNELNALVHPEIFRLFRTWITATKKDSQIDGFRVVILDAPLLLEAGWQEQVDYIVFVDAPTELRLTRALARGWSREEFFRREASQLPIEEKKRRASFLIDSQDNSDVSRQVAKILTLLRQTG